MSPDGTKRFGCRAILFDLDGVLVDSTRSVERAWKSWAERHGLDAARILEVAHGRRTEEVVRLFVPHLDVAGEARSLERAEIQSANEVRSFGGAEELLSALPPGFWAVVTSGTRALATARLAGLPFPEVLVCAEDVENGKPDPGPYLEGARLLGIPAGECVVVEDTPAGIRAARSAGMAAIAVATTHPVPKLSDADAIVQNLRDIRLNGVGENGLELAVPD